MNETITTVLYCAFVAMQVADILTTIRALDGGCVEANKIVRWVMDKLGVVPALALLVSIHAPTRGATPCVRFMPV